MDKNAKQAKAAREKAEEAALNRILYWIVGGTVLWALTFLLNRYIVYYRVAEYTAHVAVLVATKIMAVGGLVCAAAAGYWWNNARKAGSKRDLPGALCVFMAGLSVICFAAWLLYETGIKAVMVAVPVAVVLAMIAHLYQREFFLLCCQSVLALLGIWMCGKGQSTVCYAYVVVAAVILLASALLFRKAQGGNGVVELSGKKWKLFGKGVNYTLLYTGTAVALALLVVAVLGVASMALYAVAAAWLLIMAVYYTMKLM